MEPITASAPGSLMITGEHAVLHGARALVGAVEARVEVCLTPRVDRHVEIRSALGHRHTRLEAPDTAPPFHFVGRALAEYAAACPAGFNLDITADMPADIGLGTSAAVTVATLAALHAFCSQPPGPPPLPDPAALHRRALDLVHAVQGTASGADLAAAVWGGLLLYTARARPQHRYTHFPEIALFYAGYKTPTAEVIRQVEARRAQAPDGFRTLYASIDTCTGEAAAAMAGHDTPRLAEALNRHQTLMVQLGVCDPTLTDIIKRLRALPAVAAAKISGSGMGDSVLALLHPHRPDPLPSDFPYRRIPVRFSARGVTLHPPIPADGSTAQVKHALRQDEPLLAGGQ